MTLFDRLTLHLDAFPHDGAWNMAVDQAWLELSDRPVLRVYDWDRPTVTVGYAQNLAKLGSSLPEWPVMRRWTGGGVVLHENDETYSVIVPGVHPWAETRPLESYRLIHDTLASALVAAGFPGCRLAGPEDLIENAFCFVAPALHDVVEIALNPPARHHSARQKAAHAMRRRVACTQPGAGRGGLRAGEQLQGGSVRCM